MLKVQFTFRDGENKLDVIAFDASVSETHSFEADVTDFPVEDGANASDNYRSRPLRVRVEALISDYPLGDSGITKSLASTSNANHKLEVRKEASVELLTKLRKLQETGTLCDLDTGLRDYDSMAIESIEVPRDRSLKNAVRFTMSLKQVIVVESKTVQVTRVATTTGQPKQKSGPQTTEPASEAEVKKSRSAIGTFFGAGEAGIF